MIATMYGHRCNWIFVVIVMVITAWFGYSNWAYAVTYDELNAQREQAGLPFLTGNDRADFHMLVRECNGGIRYSCALARQLQSPPQLQNREPVYAPVDPQIQHFPPIEEPEYSTPEPQIEKQVSTPQHESNADQACIDRAQKMIDDSIARGGAGTSGIFMMNSCYH